MSTQSLDQAAYIMTANIGLIDVFCTDEEKSKYKAGLAVNAIVSLTDLRQASAEDRIPRMNCRYVSTRSRMRLQNH